MSSSRAARPENRPAVEKQFHRVAWRTSGGTLGFAEGSVNNGYPVRRGGRSTDFLLAFSLPNPSAAAYTGVVARDCQIRPGDRARVNARDRRLHARNRAPIVA